MSALFGSIASPSGFTLESPWKGRAREHLWRHTCGGVFSATIQSLENAPSPKTGCKFCDEEGNPGRWIAFVRRLEERGLRLRVAQRMEILKEDQSVPLSCDLHPQADVALWERKKLVVWMAPNENGKARKLLSPCPHCAAEQSQAPAPNPQKAAYLEDLAARLLSFNHAIDAAAWRGSSARDGAGKIKSLKNTVRCLSCQTDRESFVLQDLAKAEKRGSMTCPCCKHTTGPNPVTSESRTEAKTATPGWR